MSTARKYFGTDGIRGKVGKYPITPEFAVRLGWATGRVLCAGGQGKILIGQDTRISSAMFESALQIGLVASGVDVGRLGTLPTPAVAYLIKTLRAQGGVVVSASHNAFLDNGMKLFDANGLKMSDDAERGIECIIDEEMMRVVDSRELGFAEPVPYGAERYIEFCRNTVPAGISLDGLKVVVDCGNGACFQVAPRVFTDLGAEVVPIGVEPDGLNINDRCGALDPETMRATVIRERADLGIALDGDGDRVVMADGEGELLDGDQLLFIIAQERHAEGRLGDAVVGTVMNNMGLEQALQRIGVKLKRAQVGDRYVLQAMREGNWTLGGEISGHIICHERLSTGDGIVSALQVLAASQRSGRPLHELKKGMVKYPQSSVSVPLPDDVNASRLMEVKAVERAVKTVTEELTNHGRVVLRLSGTESVVRIMVEGGDPGLVERLASQLADEVKQLASEMRIFSSTRVTTPGDRHRFANAIGATERRLSSAAPFFK